MNLTFAKEKLLEISSVNQDILTGKESSIR